MLRKRFPEQVGENVAPSTPGSVSVPAGAHVRHHDFDPYPVSFPIDIVYTWVDGNDPEWQARRRACRTGGHAPVATNAARFECRGELKYSLRSVMAYAPWVRHIYLVTAGQRPAWLADHPSITVVDHAEIIDAEHLPTFNSHVIEAHLHRIPGLSEHYIYFNDDVMLTRPVPPEHFFASNGLAHLFITRSTTPNGPPLRYDTPTQKGAKNVRSLLLRRFESYMEYNFAHTFHTQRKSVHQEIRALWPEEIAAFLGNRFRGESDLPMATYMFPNYAYLTGRADFRQTSCMYFNIRSNAAARHYEVLLTRRDTPSAPYSMCLNDVQVLGNSQDADAVQAELRFLQSYFPEPSPFERAAPARSEAESLPETEQATDGQVFSA